MTNASHKHLYVNAKSLYIFFLIKGLLTKRFQALKWILCKSNYAALSKRAFNNSWLIFMLMISEVLSQRSLTGKSNKVPWPHTSFLTEKQASAKKRSAQNERRFIVLINMHFFFIPFSPESPCAQKSYASNILRATFMEAWWNQLQRHVSGSGGGWAREENNACLLQGAAVLHIKLASSTQHQSWWRILWATHTRAVVCLALQLQLLMQSHNDCVL